MIIGNKDLKREVLIVAEIGNNHEGSFSRAQELISLAAASGADAVKFQTYVAEDFIARTEEKRLGQLRKFQLSFPEFRRLSRHARKSGVLFLSTPFDLTSVLFLNDLVPAYKVASGDNTFYPLLEAVARTGKPMLLSTGFLDAQELKKSVAYIRACWSSCSLKGGLVLLHCVGSYPVEPQNAHLRTISYLSEKYDVPVGYSDHTLGINACVLSVALGARVVEKHFTDHKDFSDYRDHRLSADPLEFKEMVKQIRAAEKLLGSYGKCLTPGEKDLRGLVRRSVAAKKVIRKGAVLKQSDITWLRPGTGYPAGGERAILGRKVLRDVQKGCLITEQDLEA